jgi:hypothetical protein
MASTIVNASTHSTAEARKVAVAKPAVAGESVIWRLKGRRWAGVACRYWVTGVRHAAVATGCTRLG